MKVIKLKPQAVKILKMFHIFFCFSWIIGNVALLLLLFITHPETGDELYMRSRMFQIIDDYCIILGAMGALVTGLIYSIWTNWGFFKHPWIIVKWILIILQMTAGVFLGPPINNNVIIADQLRDAALTNPEFLNNIQITQMYGTLQSVFLIFVLVISVQKPWKVKKK